MTTLKKKGDKANLIFSVDQDGKSHQLADSGKKLVVLSKSKYAGCTAEASI
jgi:peroxiredoxin Q/BCP